MHADLKDKQLKMQDLQLSIATEQQLEDALTKKATTEIRINEIQESIIFTSRFKTQMDLLNALVNEIDMIKNDLAMNYNQ